jgi:hypothetical protein
MEHALRDLGLEPADYRLLELLPLVHVAWADGAIEGVEREKIIALGEARYAMSERGRYVLDHWLAERPSHEYVERGLGELRRLASAPDEILIDHSDLRAILERCELIAQTAPAEESLQAVTPEQEAAVAELARLLQVDHGLSWSELLREVDETTSSQDSGERTSESRISRPPPLKPW